MQIGIVGLPNVGKSTTFNLLTKLAIPAENFPFCTIEPNHVRSLYCRSCSPDVIFATLSCIHTLLR